MTLESDALTKKWEMIAGVCNSWKVNMKECQYGKRETTVQCWRRTCDYLPWARLSFQQAVFEAACIQHLKPNDCTGEHKNSEGAQQVFGKMAMPFFCRSDQVCVCMGLVTVTWWSFANSFQAWGVYSCSFLAMQEASLKIMTLLS